jgi:hypothetical protein
MMDKKLRYEIKRDYFQHLVFTCGVDVDKAAELAEQEVRTLIENEKILEAEKRGCLGVPVVGKLTKKTRIIW